MNNLILIGMPGVGKTEIGKMLSRELNWPLIDIDGVIEGKTDKSLQALLAELGPEKFCDFESLIVQQIGCNNTVIAPGGSIIYRQEAVKHLQELGVIIYLETDLQTLAARVAKNPNRGVVAFGEKTLSALWQERHPLYQKHADLVIHQNGMSVADCAVAVIEEAKRFGLKIPATC